jgi:hypothetical protein
VTADVGTPGGWSPPSKEQKVVKKEGYSIGPKNFKKCSNKDSII